MLESNIKSTMKLVKLEIQNPLSHRVLQLARSNCFTQSINSNEKIIVAAINAEKFSSVVCSKYDW